MGSWVLSLLAIVQARESASVTVPWALMPVAVEIPWISGTAGSLRSAATNPTMAMSIASVMIKNPSFFMVRAYIW